MNRIIKEFTENVEIGIDQGTGFRHTKRTKGLRLRRCEHNNNETCYLFQRHYLDSSLNYCVSDAMWIVIFVAFHS